MTDERRNSDDHTGTSATATLATRLSTAWERFAGRWQPLSSALDRGTRNSRMAGVAARCRAAFVHAWIVRWLTREPEPNVVEIDLTETRTIGPIVAVLDRIVRSLSTPVSHSRIRGTSHGTVRSFERNAVPALGGAILGFALGTLALTWDGASLPWLLALTLVAIAGGLSLTVEQSRKALSGSTVVGLLAAVIAPPGEESR